MARINNIDHIALKGNIFYSMFYSSDINNIESGIGDKLSMFIQFFAAFIAGFVIGFVFGWELTLIILAVSPLLAGSAMVMSRVSK